MYIYLYGIFFATFLDISSSPVILYNYFSHIFIMNKMISNLLVKILIVKIAMVTK